MKGFVKEMHIKYPVNDIDLNDTYNGSKIQCITNCKLIQHLQ